MGHPHTVSAAVLSTQALLMLGLAVLQQTLFHMLGSVHSLLVCSVLSLQCTAGGLQDCCSNESARAVLLGAMQLPTEASAAS